MKAKKTTWRVLATMLILVLAVSMLAGCSKPKSVEEAIAKDEKAKKQIESIADQNGMEIKIEGNTVTYLVKLDSEVDKELIEERRDGIEWCRADLNGKGMEKRRHDAKWIGKVEQ